MGYLSKDVWKANLGILAGLAILVGAIVGGVVWIRAHRQGAGPGDRADFVKLAVEGAASNGVAVTLIDSNGSSLLESDSSLPFHRSWPRDGSSFYQLQAQALGSGSIRCRIALGKVVEVHHASGSHACVAGVDENTRTDGWSTS